MGLYKRCEHKNTTAIETCLHDWWGQFMFQGVNTRMNLTTWSGKALRSEREAAHVYQRMRDEIRADTFDPTPKAPSGTARRWENAGGTR